ncbi:MAG: hypothetical protein WBM45_16890, partial [Woeseiaceae bacterium]
CSALAPIAAAAKPGTWDREAKQKLRELLRAKGSERELDYARHLRAHDQFLRSLRAVCRDTQRRER